MCTTYCFDNYWFPSPSTYHICFKTGWKGGEQNEIFLYQTIWPFSNLELWEFNLTLTHWSLVSWEGLRTMWPYFYWYCPNKIKIFLYLTLQQTSGTNNDRVTEVGRGKDRKQISCSTATWTGHVRHVFLTVFYLAPDQILPHTTNWNKLSSLIDFADKRQSCVEMLVQ